MSMINEFVEKLRNYAAEYRKPPYGREVEGTPELLDEAADIIEELSAKLASANMERSEQYYKSNSEFVEKLIERLEELKKAESDREDYSDNHDYYDDWEYAFGDGTSYGRHYAYGRSIKIIEELAGEYKDVPDTNVGKNLSENLIEKIKFGIEASNINDDYTTGLRNGMRYCLSLIDGKEPEFERCRQGWILVSERLPENTDPVNITWVNHKPEPYYADIKDKPFTATGCYCDGKWYWYSVLCQDYLDEYRYSENDYIDNGIEVIAWMPLPESYKGE